MLLALSGFALAVLLAWQLVVVAGAVAVLVLARRETGSLAIGLLAGGMLAAGLAIYPLHIADARSAAREGARINERGAEVYGSIYRGFRPRDVEQPRRLIPEDATYYLDEAENTPTAFRFWTRWRLLPRIAVATPEEADWIISRRVDPRRLGLPLAEVHTVTRSVTVARVER